MFRMKTLSIALLVILMTSCSHYESNKTDPLRNIASEDLTGNKTGNPILRSCIGNLEEELDPVTITNKFKVELTGSSKYISNTTTDICSSKVLAFREYDGYPGCSSTTQTLKSSNGIIEYKATAVPDIGENFIKKYRKNLLCNRIATCEQKASLDDSISVNTLDKIHRVYENNKCDTITVDVVENKIVKVIQRPVPSQESEANNGRSETQEIAATSVTVSSKDPNAQFCPLRSTPVKCMELSGVCEWVAPSTGYCKARVGSTDPNAKFCQIRSSRSKCKELSGVCEWNEGSAGFCKAR